MRLLSGAGKEEFFWQDGCGQNNLWIFLSYLLFFAVREIQFPQRHTGQGSSLFFRKRFCFSKQVWLTWVWTIILILRESSRTAHNMSPWQSKRSGTLPGQVYRASSLTVCLQHSKNKGYFEQAREPFLQPLCWHPQVWKQEFRGHLPSESVRCPFMALVPMQAHKPFLNLPTLPVSAPPVAASSTDSWLRCEEVLPSALSWSSIKIEGNFC